MRGLAAPAVDGGRLFGRTRVVQAVILAQGSGPVISDLFGVNVLAAQSTRSTSNCCRMEAICIDTSSPSHLPSMALPKGASLLMT
jgi:hypothetical protein